LTNSNRKISQNLLLSRLPAADRRRLLAHCDLTELVVADALAEAGQRTRQVVFPLDSFISLINPVDSRSQLEVGLVGNEGMVGISLFLGISTSPLRALVQGAGRAWCMDAADFSYEVERSAALRSGLNRYVYVLLSQFAQAAACTRFHVLEARLARWLLVARDRAHSDELHVTHDDLAHMLGVRRVGVTHAASSLRHRKLIQYRRGDLQILDGKRLEAAACACYATVHDTYARVLS
jgi:CRP-like cAMP-binding protein